MMAIEGKQKEEDGGQKEKRSVGESSGESERIEWKELYLSGYKCRLTCSN